MKATQKIGLTVCGVAVAVSVAAAQTAPPSHDYLHGAAERDLVYVTLPGSLERPVDNNGNGIVVLDAKNNYNFVKRIQTWDVPASQNALQVSGVAASPVTQLLYVATRGRLGAFDLTTDKKVWDNAYDGQCCERPQVSPDGATLYVGSDLKDFWYVINARTGALITKIMTPESAGSHNLNLSLDGKLIFMSPSLHKVMSIADASTNKVIKTIPFGDNIRVFVINHDASLIYSNTNNLLGFEIADVKAGKVIQHVEVEGFGWREKWNATPRQRVPHGCPSHGIALTPDEKELWLADGLNNMIHIFDNTVMPPKQTDNIRTTAGPFWITVGLDGKYAYVSSGDVIDMKTRKIVGQMKDEYGRTMYSEKLLNMVFENGKLIRVANQFGNGLGATELTRISPGHDAQ
jgi:DNA-binding beta-propeller fold protein YncE